jgi:hypothetical protein
MTSAVVGKVVNMTVSRNRALPKWSTWLTDWSREDGAQVNVERIDMLTEEATEKEESTEAAELESDRILQ